MIRSMKRLAGVIAVAMGWLLGTSSAWAALPAKPDPLSAPGKPYLAYLIAFVLIFGVAAVTFKNAKRTHLD